MTPAEFRSLGHALIDWVADYREGVGRRPVMSGVAPGAVRAALPPEPPDEGGGLTTIVDDLARVVLPGITHWNHPRFFAYFPSNSSLASTLAELVTAGLGAQCMSWQTSPAATEVEEVMMEWLGRATGLPGDFTGVIQDSASASNFVALVCARERATDYSQERDGASRWPAPLTVYTSEQAHASVQKAARLAGIGASNVRAVPTDDAFAMRVDALEAAIARDLAAGLRPCAVVATAGTTATTAVDPLDAIAGVAAAHGVWVHVDAALAGAAMILPECRPLFAGIERADSIVWDPHKWLGTTFDLSAYYVRDAAHLVRVMATSPSYLRTNEDGRVRNLRDWGVPLGRRFRALKLWFLLREQGLVGLRARLRRDLANAQWLGREIAATAGWRLIAPVNFQTLCVRHVPEHAVEEEVDAHNLAWVERINRSGAAYLTTALVGGRHIVRVSIGAEPTERSDVEALWAMMRREATRAP